MKKYLLALILFSFMLAYPKTGHALFDSFVDEFDVEVESLNRYFPESDIKNESGEIGVVETDVSYNYTINRNSDISWELDFGSKNVFLSDNSESIDLPANLVGRSMRVAAQLPAPLIDDNRYRVGFSVIPTYNTDSWEDSFKDFEYGAFRWLSEYWVEYQGMDKLTWKLGVIVRPDYDLMFLPIVGMDYRFNDKWSFRLTSDDIGILYQVNEKLELFTEHRYELEEYEISSNGRDGRVLRHKQNTTGAGIKYALNEKSFVKISSGVAYNRSFRFVDDEDAEKAVLDDSVYATLELVLKF